MSTLAMSSRPSDMPESKLERRTSKSTASAAGEEAESSYSATAELPPPCWRWCCCWGCCRRWLEPAEKEGGEEEPGDTLDEDVKVSTVSDDCREVESEEEEEEEEEEEGTVICGARIFLTYRDAEAGASSSGTSRRRAEL